MTKHAPEFWNRIARKYAARQVMDEDAYAATLTRARAYLGADDQVLEIGCGTGTTALKLADAVAGITATDFADAMLDIAREKAAAQGVQNVRFERAEAQALPEGPFDAVMAFSLLHLVDDLPATLGAVHAALKPGGHLISKTICLGSGGWYFRPLIALLRLAGKAPPLHYLSREGLQDQIRTAGFEILETGDYPVRPPAHFIVARKGAS